MARQKQLPGVEDSVVEEIETAAENYVDHRDSRMNKLTLEIEARDKLIEVLRKHKKNAYSSREFSIELIDGKTKVKVKRGGDDDDDND